MTTSEIITLLQAGYTKDEIDMLAGSPAPADPDPVPADPAPADPVPADPVPADPDPAPDVAALIDAALKPLQDQIKTLTGLVQKQNRAAARTDPGEPVTIDAIVADFFGAPAGKGGGK